MNRQLSAVVVLCVVLGCQELRAQTDTPSSARPSGVSIRTGIYDLALDARVDALLLKMTLEEKVGQLVQYSAGQPTGPGTGRTDYKDMIARGQIGALLNVIDTPLLN